MAEQCSMTSMSQAIIPEVAQFLFTEGATLIVTDVPEGTNFGIDLKSWNTGRNFKGIKMIPPGFHFIHYSAVNGMGEHAPRVGFFHTFEPREFVAKRWDSIAEDISSESVDEDMIERMRADIKNLDRYLGPYPYDVWQRWKELTSGIDATLVERCKPLCGFVRSALELENCDHISQGREQPNVEAQRRAGSGLSVEAKEELLLPNLKPKPGTELRLTELPMRNYPDGAMPMEITKYSLDTSYALESILIKFGRPAEIVGELQLAFVCFLTGQSLDAFEHWKRLITLMCGADEAISDRRGIFVKFLRTVEIQLKHVPEDFLCDIVANNNFVYHNLRKLFANIETNSDVDDRFKSEVNRVKNRISNKFFWDFEDLHEVPDDEAPVVVSLDDI